MTSSRKSGAVAGSEFLRAERAARYIRSKTKLAPRIAVVLGSGLGAFAGELRETVAIPYGKIPGFPPCAADGHAGRLVIGRIGNLPLTVMQGRAHFYEGHSIADVTFPMRVFHRLGIVAAVLTNAAGAINLHFQPGSLALISDHINLQGQNPCIGANEAKFGARFFDMTGAYDRRFRDLAVAEAQRLGLELLSGVYAAVSGPSYETPAEIRYLRIIGADMVGMSTVPEVIAARHMGMRVLAISCITNRAAGLAAQPLTHEEVLETAARASSKLTALLGAVLPRLTAELSR